MIFCERASCKRPLATGPAEFLAEGQPNGSPGSRRWTERVIMVPKEILRYTLQRVPSNW